MPQCLRARMRGKVLGAGGGFQVAAVALQPPHKGDAQPGCQIGILSIGFVPSSPARVAEYVDVGGPESQAFVNVAVFQGGKLVVLCPALRRDDVGDLLKEIRIKHRRKPDGLGEDGGRPRARDAVQRF